MLHLFYSLRDSLFGEESFFYDAVNVLKYITVRGGGAALTSFVLVMWLAGPTIRRLQALKAGQPIRQADEVHRLAELHGAKAGTPTMGGILLLGATLAASLLWARPDAPMVWATLGVTLAMGLLGFADDFLKVRRRNSKGVRARTKILAQAAIAIAACTALARPWEAAGALPVFSAGADWTPQGAAYFRALYVPFMKAPLIADMGWLTPLWWLLVIAGASNAVNLTDGLDGLATGCAMTVAGAYALFAYAAGHAIFAKQYLFIPHHPDAGELAVVLLAFLGAAMGFLWHNCHPARIFMGDTGSLAIGGLIAMCALCVKQEVLLAIVGGVFVMEAGSVILQVASFKTTGRRIFRMSPIHHHFELKGWKETQVIARFWILSLIFALIGLATLKLR